MKVILIFLLFLILGCSDSEIKLNIKDVKNSTKFVVDKTVKYNDYSLTSYHVYPVDSSNLNVTDTWIQDTTGKFDTGDTLIFVKKK